MAMVPAEIGTEVNLEDPKVLALVAKDLPAGTSFLHLFSDLFSDERLPKEDENEGSNLFVSGIAPRMGEDELQELFSKYGRVDKVNIMVDPHSRESRGFGFVKMNTSEEADAAKDALTGEERYGRVLTVEKARRARPSLYPTLFRSNSNRNTNSRKILWTS